MFINSGVLSVVSLLFAFAYGHDKKAHDKKMEKKIDVQHTAYQEPIGSQEMIGSPEVLGSPEVIGSEVGGGIGYDAVPFYVDPDREKRKCETKLKSFVWDYLFYLGFTSPSWCCMVGALAPPTFDEDTASDYVPEFDHVQLVVESVFKFAKDNGYSEDDMNESFSSIPSDNAINGEELGYSPCNLGYHKCQLIWGIMYAYSESFEACYCYYRSMAGCQCSDCLDPNLWLDEANAYAGLSSYEDGKLDMDKLIQTRIATCVDCPDHPPTPFNECYGYCNMVKALPYNVLCFEDE